MKHLLLSLSVAAAIMPNVAAAAVYRSTAYFNELHAQLGNRAITPRVIDKTIYPQIDAAHPVRDQTWPNLSDLQKEARTRKVMYNRLRNAVAVRLFCHSDIRGTADELKCGEVK